MFNCFIIIRELIKSFNLGHRLPAKCLWIYYSPFIEINIMKNIINRYSSYRWTNWWKSSAIKKLLSNLFKSYLSTQNKIFGIISFFFFSKKLNLMFKKSRHFVVLVQEILDIQMKMVFSLVFIHLFII